MNGKPGTINIRAAGNIEVSGMRLNGEHVVINGADLGSVDGTLEVSNGMIRVHERSGREGSLTVRPLRRSQ